MENSLARRLRVLRIERGLTVGQASDLIGIDRHTLGRVEAGTQKPNGPTLLKIARGYGVPVEELIGEEPAPKASAPPSSPGTADEERRHRELVESVVDFLGWRPPDIEQRPEEYRDAMVKAADDVVKQPALERVERNRSFVDDPDQALRRVEQGHSGEDPPADDAQNARGA